jgi:hypothetical protein
MTSHERFGGQDCQLKPLRLELPGKIDDPSKVMHHCRCRLCFRYNIISDHELPSAGSYKVSLKMKNGAEYVNNKIVRRVNQDTIIAPSIK